MANTENHCLRSYPFPSGIESKFCCPTNKPPSQSGTYSFLQHHLLSLLPSPTKGTLNDKMSDNLNYLPYFRLFRSCPSTFEHPVSSVCNIPLFPYLDHLPLPFLSSKKACLPNPNQPQVGWISLSCSIIGLIVLGHLSLWVVLGSFFL